MRRWAPDKISALVLICGCIALIASGIDGEVKSILGMASVYLFGTSMVERRANLQIKEKEAAK